MIRVVLYVTALAAASLAAALSIHPLEIEAADTRNFNPELIISDSAFRQDDSMTASQIQWFLESKNSICLKDKYVLSLHDSDGDGDGDEPYGLGKSNKVRVSALIKQASRLYGINPRVILATLEKEQGLITRQDCPSWRYNTALGYGCPDNEPCDNSAYGFTRQIDYGAWHLRGFFLDTYPVPPTVPGNKLIYYNPNSNCGGKNINIRNRATAALYSYTPYQPNGATLAAQPGEAVNCGAYGNLNFWRYYSDWFGLPTAVKYELMSQPRWMKTTTALRKIDLKTGAFSGQEIPIGTEIRFERKSNYDGKTYLQTVHDQSVAVDRGIELSKLADITVEFTDMSVPRWLNTASPIRKVHPVTNKVDGSIIDNDLDLYYTSKFTIGDETYLRSRHDSDQNALRGIPMSKLVDSKVAIRTMSNPRWFEIKDATFFKDIAYNKSTYQALNANSRIFFTHKFSTNGVLYLNDKHTDAFVGINITELTPKSNGYVPMSSPRVLTLKQDTNKINTQNLEDISGTLSVGRKISFSSKVTINDTVYLRTSHDGENDADRGIPLHMLEETE